MDAEQIQINQLATDDIDGLSMFWKLAPTTLTASTPTEDVKKHF